MSTVVESIPTSVPSGESTTTTELIKPEMKNEMDKSPLKKTQQRLTTSLNDQKSSQQHPLHQFDVTKMNKFYETCMSKMVEHNPQWKPNDWTQTTPMPATLTMEQRSEWPNPMVLSNKQMLYEAFRRLASEGGEPMILMPSFDYGDILNFERFLQALKTDGINAISKYKQYLNNKEMRKLEIDLVIVHPKYGVLLFEVKDCDHLDAKRRSRARIMLTNAANCFKSMGRLIFEAKNWSNSEASVPIFECVVLPNVEERPMTMQQQQQQSTNQLVVPSGNHNQSSSSTTSSHGRHPRMLSYMIKSDLMNATEFTKWWKTYVVEPRLQRDAEMPDKMNKFDLTTLNMMLGLISCIRNNSILPIVCSEPTTSVELGPRLDELSLQEQEKLKTVTTTTTTETTTTSTEQMESEKKLTRDEHFSPALNIYAEFFSREHEAVRSNSKVVIMSKDVEKIRRTVCKQIFWLLLNDHQKKISVVCSEMNKCYYEEFFARQRKIYTNCTNVRFYTDLESCTIDGQHSSTLKKDVETWFFDHGLNKPLESVMERVKELSSFWVFTTEEEKLMTHWKSDMETMKSKLVNLDMEHKESSSLPLVRDETRLKLPLRIHCDVLVIGDIIGTIHLKTLYRLLMNNNVPNLSSMYHPETHHHQRHHHHHNHHHNQQQQQQYPMYTLAFNPVKKIKSVKFIRGGSIDNIRNSLKMHDSIQAQVVLMHVGDEDLFKTRSSVTTSERIKELATLVREYCPKSFTIMSSLMRRMSRTENIASNDVNKCIMNFCKQTKDTNNLFYMLNSHFDPDYHTQEGRILNNKGLHLYIDNFLFFVDHFFYRSNKQN